MGMIGGFVTTGSLKGAIKGATMGSSLAASASARRRVGGSAAPGLRTSAAQSNGWWTASAGAIPADA
jgi:hypothetical protein